jgi:hypothetical protein
MFKTYALFGFFAGSAYGIAHLIGHPLKEGLTWFEHYAVGIPVAIAVAGGIGAATGLVCALCATMYRRIKR